MKPNWRFFPSPAVSWYMARTFVARSAAVLFALLVILMTLDLLGESGDILGHPGNGQRELWYYASLRAPQIAAFLLPFSALLGTLITLARMNQNSEIVSMKAAGISAHQILAPLVAASLAIAGISFWFEDHVTARATARLTAWQNADYGPIPDTRGVVPNIWVRVHEDLIHAGSVSGRGPRTVLHDVTYYDRTADKLTGVVTAPLAVQAGGAWQLRGARRFDVAAGTVREVPSVGVAQGVTPDRFTLADVNGDGMSFRTLAEAIAELHAAGRPTSPLETVLWHKVVSPLSTMLMPLLAGVAGFGLARAGKLFVRIVAGMTLGFAYFVADNFALAMGNLGAYPPLLAAWAPFLLFLLIGEAVLIRTEE